MTKVDILSYLVVIIFYINFIEEIITINCFDFWLERENFQKEIAFIDLIRKKSWQNLLSYTFAM